jgi:hypothetical protein
MEPDQIRRTRGITIKTNFMTVLIEDEGSHLPLLMQTGHHLFALDIDMDNLLGSRGNRRRHWW